MAMLETSLDRWALRWALAWVFGWALFCVMTPIEVGFDVLHYHIQDGWSALNGRLERDLAPSGMHSYFNPISHMITQALIETFPAAIVSFLLGALQAAILIPLYLLCRRVLVSVGHENRISALLLALAGFFNYAMLTVTASIRVDHWSAGLFILALLVLVPKDGAPAGWKRAGVAAFLVGLSAGLKLTSVIHVAGIAAAILVAVPGLRGRLQAAAAAGVAGLSGILLTGGWWMWKLWTVIGNPVFPMANGAFRSPFGPLENFRDERTPAQSIWDVLFYPVNAASRPYNEFGTTWMQDLPIAFFYIAILILGWVGYRTYRGNEQGTEVPPRALLTVFAGAFATLTVWFPLFMVGRYAMSVWMVSPLVFAATLLLIWPALREPRRALGWFGGMLAVCVISANVVQLRRVPVPDMWGPYIQVAVPSSVDFQNAEVIFTGPYPSSFLAAYLPESATFMFTQTQGWADGAERVLKQMVRQRIDSSNGPFVAVMVDVGSEEGSDALPVIFSRLRDELGLVADRKACGDFVTSVDNEQAHWIACPLVKAD
ncbi:hypothetical protein [Hyphomonas jannaschiana]|uniref:hypothetical protein n=1 Tax=Hyphomonas jannaschiana TaxID=86 RepID=UPI0035C6C454